MSSMQEEEHTRYYGSVKPQAYLESKESSGLVTVDKTRKNCWDYKYILKRVKCLKANGAYLKLVQQILVECFLFSPWSLCQWFSQFLLWNSIEFNMFTRQLNSCEPVRTSGKGFKLLGGVATWEQELPVMSNTFFPWGSSGSPIH